MSASSRQFRGGWARSPWGPWRAALALAVALASGCTVQPARPRSSSATGRYAGVDSQGRKLELTLWEDGQGVAGVGQWENERFGLSLVSSHQATGELREGAQTRAVVTELSADGAWLTLQSGKDVVTLERVAGAVEPSPEPLTGRFAHKDPSLASFQLLQRGNLLVGTGQVRGQPAALSGFLAPDQSLQAELVFGDGVRAPLSGASEGRTLKLSGMGLDLQLARSSSFDVEAP